MELRPLRQKDRVLCEDYLRESAYSLSGYSFENIFIWRPLFEVLLGSVKCRPCLFFKNEGGCFMPLPPLGGGDPEVLSLCFDVMESFNGNKELSRIENIEEGDLDFFRQNRLRIHRKTEEYIVSSSKVAFLSGKRFKKQRSQVNFFHKNTRALFRDYTCQDEDAVLDLYRRWMRERESRDTDRIYRAMLHDSFKVFSELLASFESLHVRAKVVECDGRIQAFSSGFPLHRRLFCINFEVADLSFKGLASYVFSQWAKSLKDEYPEINIMDAWGLERLKKTKLSFRPLRSVASFTASLA